MVVLFHLLDDFSQSFLAQFMVGLNEEGLLKDHPGSVKVSQLSAQITQIEKSSDIYRIPV